MNARELRIGNLVECKVFGDTYTDRFPHYGKNVFTVFSACKDFVKIDIGFDALRKVEVHEVNPIPLTKEWLKKFGFIDDGYKPFGKRDFLFIENVGVAYKLSLVDNTPKYVHQLQNLYFALTGEELTIPEK